MERNSLGQVIVKENEPVIIGIPCKESFITITQYQRFLLDDKEFTELVPIIDKDTLIATLTSELNFALERINQLTPTSVISSTTITGSSSGNTNFGSGGNNGGGNVATL